MDAKSRRSSTPSPVFTVPFTHVAQQESLPAILAEFARIEGYNALVSPSLKGEVTGNFEQTNPYEFLASMRAAYQVNWFQQGRTINFYAQQETQQAFLTPSIVKAKTLLSLFREAGILSPQLSIKLLNNRNVLFVRAPGFYIDQLRQAMTSMEQSQVNRITMRVFPLKHAWAEDKEVSSSNDSRIVVPGVASILNTMVNGGPKGETTISSTSPVQTGLLGQGLAATAKSNNTPEKTTPSESSKGQNTTPVSIIADPRVNAVVITDAEYRMEYYARVIADLDRPVRLVEIHAAIVDIDSNYQKELGINYQGVANLGNGWRIGGSAGTSASAGTLPEAGSASSSGLSFSTLYTRGTNYFLTRVSALEKDGVARMLGKPSVLTTDNVQATLENTNTYYIPVSGYQATDLFKVETGTILNVTPHIIPGRVLKDGTVLPNAIKLIVSVQDNRNDSSSTFVVSETNPQPLKQTKINTQAIVSEGQSLLIAGYYQEKQSDGEDGVPGLKNIPILGRLFGKKALEHSRMERLVLITPRIMNLDEKPVIPLRVDDPRFSRSPTGANYEERVPTKPVVGGCTRRRLDYASTPDVPPKPLQEAHPRPMGEPANPIPKPVQDEQKSPNVEPAKPVATSVQGEQKSPTSKTAKPVPGKQRSRRGKSANPIAKKTVKP
ncbi:MAG: type III secretion system outer membrane ring subunit SctC [Desulfovibrionaceae bacterium]|nr:type III secretion system outer membrane ring subunit SctC [Desulfovibrionaceae bacterium]